MRVRELLAANAFCLLAAIAVAACARVEQPVGEYSTDEPALQPAQPTPPKREEIAGNGSILSDAGPQEPVMSDPPTGMATAGAPGFPGFWLPPPILLDAGMPGSTTAPATCRVVEAERRRLDMYIMLDSNITLPATGVWEKMTEGLGSFVNDYRSRGTGVGVRFFGLTCTASDYDTPTVEVDVLPKNAEAITDSIRSRPPWSASPMLPALQGGITHQQRRAVKNPEAKQIVVLVSDGFTQDITCLYSTQNLADAASNGYNDDPSIETHVVGVGVTTQLSQPLDELITRLGAFNTIADAGGSRQAITTAIGDDATAFSEALQRVRRNAAPCEFNEPAGVATSEFGVARFPLAQELQRYRNRTDCGNKQGWYYAVESLPTPVTMCPATCTWLREADERQIGILLSCASTTPPP
ncbi:MAG TPA: vWA domain-containing protein [Polyangiales bacterium]|nr:vWA domain-containing protein [Polyangiales bacterium]